MRRNAAGVDGLRARNRVDTWAAPATDTNAEFAAIAKMAAGGDTLESFLREMRLRFPEASAKKADY